MKVYLGVDNGSSGSLGVITPDEYFYYQIPVKRQQDYHKKKKIISRIDVVKLRSLLLPFKDDDVMIGIERPMVFSGRFSASLSASRALEAVLIVVEDFGFSYMFLDSKTWQSEILPRGTKTTPELKAQSYYTACRLFPKAEDVITKQKDGDGILISEYLKRYNLGTLQKNYKNP